MKKRLQKKAEKSRRQEIHKILDLVLDINGLEQRQQRITGSLPTAHFEFSGHVALVEVQVNPKGWGESCERDIMRAWLTRGNSGKVIQKLENFKKEKDPGDGHLQRSVT